MAEVSEELGFSIEGALAGIQTISDALTTVVDNFAQGLAQALETLTSVGADVAPLADSLDVAGLGPAVETALTDATSTPVPIEGDVSALESGIGDAVDQTQTVPIDADVSEAEGAISGLDVPIDVPVDADVSQAADAISGLEGETIVIPAEIDTGGIEESLQSVGAGAQSTAKNIGGLTSQTTAFAAAAALGRGEASGLEEGVGLLGGAAPQVAAGFAAAGVSVGVFFHQALDAQAAVQRLNQSLGPFAAQIEHLQVGSLDADLSKLALSLGADDDSLRNVASTLFLFQKGAGTADATAAQFSATTLALASRAVALNPALGRVEDVAGRLGNVLARGGRFASAFGINLQSTEIKARAAENAARGLGDGTSFAALQIAGGQLALEKYGASLDKDIAQGTKNPIIQLSALRQKFEEATEAIGRPLVAPIFQLLTDIEPVAEAVGRTIGSLAGVVLPALGALASGLGVIEGPLNLVADGLDLLASGGTPASLAIVAVGIAAAASQAPFFGAAAAAAAFGTALEIATGPIGIVLLGLAAVGVAARLAGDDSKQAAVDTSTLDDAFKSTTASGTTLTTSLDGVSASVDKYLQKQLGVGRAGDTQIEAANRLGASYAELRGAITGSTDDYENLIQRLFSASGAFDDLNGPTTKLFDTLTAGRDALQTNAALALATAVSTGALTDAQLKAAQASHQLSTEESVEGAVKFDAITVLRELGPLIDAQTRSTNANALAVAQSSPAYAQLVEQLASGAITVDTFAGSLAQFGFDAATATTFAKNLQSAIAGIVSTSVGALPKASDAISTYASTVKSDLDKVNQAVAGHEDGVGLLFAKLVQDTDPAKFTENLLADAAAIAGFAQNLAKVATVAPELALEIGKSGAEAGGQLAAGFASDLNKAKIAEGALTLVDTATTNFSTGVETRAAAYEASGAKGATAYLTGLGITIDQDTSVGDAAASAAERASARFQPNFDRGIHSSTTAAAAALATDPTISQAAGEIGLRAVANFESAFGPVSTAQAAIIALQGAHDAIAKDPTLATASAKKGDDTSAAFKPKIDKATKQAFDQAAIIIPQLTNIATAAGTAGHAVGVAFDTGMVQGIDGRRQEVIDAAIRVAAAAEEAARRRHESNSPSQVGVRIGRDFSAGIAIGLSDTSGVASAGAQLASTVASSAALTNLGATVTSSVVAGFNDPATVDAAVTRLQELVAKAAKDAAATAQASAASSFASGLISALPDAGTAISTFGQNVGQAAAAQTAAFADVHKAYKQYADDQRERRALEAALIPATEALRQAQVRLFNDTTRGANKFTLGIDKDAVKQAQKDVDDLQRKITTSTQSLASDQTNIATSSKTLTDSVAALAAASDPATFVKNLRAQTAANEAFQANLRKLIRQGDTDLAEQLAQAGPTAAGKLAASLASKPALAKTAEAAIDHAAQFSKSYQAFLEKQFAPEVQSLATKIGASTGLALNAGISVNGVPSPIAQTVSVAGPASAATAASVQAAPTSQTLNLDLAIELPDGTILNARQTVKVPATAQELARIKLRTKAAVIA